MAQIPKYDPKLSRTNREAYADMLADCERELRAAQEALRADDSNENRDRYAKAVFAYDRIQGQFPFIAAGARRRGKLKPRFLDFTAAPIFGPSR